MRGTQANFDKETDQNSSVRNLALLDWIDGLTVRRFDVKELEERVTGAEHEAFGDSEATRDDRGGDVRSLCTLRSSI